MPIPIELSSKHYRGFTIVELLIVVVVIAVLAAIVTVTFNGIKARALNAQTASGLSAMEKALKLYKVETSKPLYIEDQYLATYGLSGNQYYAGGIGMVGVCASAVWPSDVPVNNYTSYCGINGTYHNFYHRAMTDMLTALPIGKVFPSMPTMSSVSIAAVRSTGEIDNYTVQGIRYAYNGSATNPVSYLYYVAAGKQCYSGDVSVRVQATQNIGIGPGGSFTGFTETGGDYTNNNTQYCVRTFSW